MNKLKLPAFHDIARIIAPSDAETERRLFDYYTNPFAGFFSYRRAQSLCRYAFGHMLPLNQILDGCKAEHTKQGQASNTEVLRLVWNLAADRSVRTHELKPKVLAIRKDLYIRVAPPFYFVEGDNAYVYWLQPRKNYALGHAELDLLASMIKATFLVDDFRNVGFEVCDLSALNPAEDREPRVSHLESFNIISAEEIADKLQRFARCYDRLVAKGIEPSKRAPKKRPPNEPDLFPETE